jgi:hypothetical protein
MSVWYGIADYQVGMTLKITQSWKTSLPLYIFDDNATMCHWHLPRGVLALIPTPL